MAIRRWLTSGAVLIHTWFGLVAAGSSVPLLDVPRGTGWLRSSAQTCRIPMDEADGA
jgi:hypothetical protein